MELYRNDFLISTDREKLNIPFIHEFLSKEADWSRGIPLDRVQKSIENSLNFGLYHQEQQIGFARIISDFSTIAYLGDVFILKEYRGSGLSKWLMESIMAHEELQGLRRWILLTDTAEWLYKKYGFQKVPKPELYMEKHNPQVYSKT
ncbi:N-acetyltransferase [Euzebyella marina]|uniref:N-acetyltransferase n=1 Tax=Euzebyella marina TaxID=1761453 RepID=A0A3G2L7Y5_9FLAO|nr:GNAT family N-acetyltransferase [Euzebyella marina]AYN68375.1 N-acetyltransferase [Euzebyella marina]